MGFSFRRSRGHWLVVAAALALTCGAATAGAMGLTDNPSLRKAAASPGTGHSPSPTATASVGPTPKLARGAHPMKFGLDFGTGLLTESAAQVRASLQDAAAIGAGWIRVDLPWDAVQPNGPDAYDWTAVDQEIGTAHSLGLEVDAILDNTPFWEAAQSCQHSGVDTEFCPPAPADFAKFAKAAATRYGNAGVGAWEIWNEPNISARWWPFPDAAAYQQLLTTTTKAILGVEPNAFIMMGGLAVVPDDASMGYVSQNTFLTSIVSVTGSMANIDAISLHPFSAPTLPSVAGDYQDISSSPGNLLSILQAHGDVGTQIWITESGDTEYDGAAEYDGRPATAAQLQAQAAYAADLVKTVSTNPNVAADFWFSDQDVPSQQLYWGLRDANGAARPVLASLRAAIKACGCSR